MDQKINKVMFSGVVAMVAVATSPLLDVVWYSAVVVVVVV
jgi:cytochrome c-type biogenesis protein CcmH/NrfG